MLADDRVRVLAALRGRETLALQQARKAADGDDRRLELVRERVDKVRLQQLEPPQLRRHLVEAPDALGEVARVLARGDADAEVPLRDGARRRKELRHGAQIVPV